MFLPNNFFLIVFNVFVVHCKVQLHEYNEEGLLEDKMINSHSARASSELDEKKRIAQEYLDSLAETEKTWVDPYDMAGYGIDFEAYSPPMQESFFSSESKSESTAHTVAKDSSESQSTANTVAKDSSDFRDGKILFPSNDHDKCALEDIYISRWVKMIASKVENNPQSSLIIPLSSETISNLVKISAAKSIKISEFDELLSNFIRNADIITGVDHYWNLYALYVIIGFCTILAVIAVFVIQKCARHHPYLSILIVILVISVFWHWMNLYQKQIAKKHQLLSSKAPLECQASEFSIFGHIYESFKSLFVKNNCEKYYEALMVDPIWEVSLTVAITETVAAMCFQPLYSGSKALNVFFNTLFDDLPIHVMIIVTSLLFLILMMRFNYKVRFPFFMGGLEPAGVHYNHIEEVKSPMAPKTFSRINMKESSSNECCDSLENTDYCRETSTVQKRMLENKCSKSNISENLPVESCKLLQDAACCKETHEELSICLNEKKDSRVSQTECTIFDEQGTVSEKAFECIETERESEKVADISEETNIT